MTLGGTGIADGVRFVAALALGCLGAVGDAGGIVVGNIVFEAMPQRSHIGVHIRIAAVLAGVGGVALCSTGRIRHHAGVIVNQLRDLPGLEIVATIAVPAFLALGFQSRLLRHIPLAVRMPQCIDVAIHIAIATDGTGISRITLFGTGRLSDHYFIIMPRCFNLAGFEVIAVSTISAFFSGFSAGGFSCDCPITELMPSCIHVGIHIAFAAL